MIEESHMGIGNLELGSTREWRRRSGRESGRREKVKGKIFQALFGGLWVSVKEEVEKWELSRRAHNQKTKKWNYLNKISLFR